MRIGCLFFLLLEIAKSVCFSINGGLNFRYLRKKVNVNLWYSGINRNKLNKKRRCTKFEFEKSSCRTLKKKFCCFGQSDEGKLVFQKKTQRLVTIFLITDFTIIIFTISLIRCSRFSCDRSIHSFLPLLLTESRNCSFCGTDIK